MTSPADETTPPAELKTYEVEVLMTVQATDETAAKALVDETLQRAWDTDRGRHFVKPWHFELLADGLVTDVTEEVRD